MSLPDLAIYSNMLSILADLEYVLVDEQELGKYFKKGNRSVMVALPRASDFERVYSWAIRYLVAKHGFNEMRYLFSRYGTEDFFDRFVKEEFIAACQHSFRYSA